MIQKQVILKTFGTGQITLPKEWRDEYKINYVRADIKGKNINLSPLDPTNPLGVEEVDEQIDEPGYTTIFDARKFGYPRGIPADLLLKALDSVIDKKGKSYGQNRKISRQTQPRRKPKNAKHHV